MTAISSKTILSTLAPVSIIAAVCSWAPPAQAQSLVTNGTFDAEDYAPWWGYAAENADDPTLSAMQTLAVTEGKLCSTITVGGENPWDVILGLSDLALLPNQYYHVTFTATSDNERKVRFKTGLGDTPYTDYFIKTFTLTSTPTVVDFTYLNLRDDPAAQIQFHIGGSAGTVCVDDIILEPVAAPVAQPYVTPSLTGNPLKAHAALVKMGVAVDTPTFLSRPDHNAIVAGEFSMITPANSMKMNLIQPTEGVFDYTDTDALYAWAQTNGLEFRGHPLVWHTQVPGWISSGTQDRDQMIAVMYAHIDALTQHYPNLPYWDVVNEAIENGDAGWGFRSTPWHDRIGDDFIDLAFQRARMNAPTAKLVYNDYNIEVMGNAKADKVFELVSDMKTRGIPIDAVGFQSHYYVSPDGSTGGVPDVSKIKANMDRYATIGIDVQITECDFRIGKPSDATKVGLQDKFYADLLQACIDAPNCSHYTLWGLSDYDSWVPSTFPEFDFAHIFDTSFVAKSSYHALTNVFAKYGVDGSTGGTGAGGSAGTGAGGSAGDGAGGSAGTGTGTGSGGTGTAAPKSSESSGSCTVNPGQLGGSTPWFVTALVGLAISLGFRRASKARKRSS